ncbi:DUF983 domain-containing protein [Faunimonas sp. B44]|uniref:DUF983 domain-containing protein n=1 Tax=Faunimonas sp. B44 TaxID=3461493 RepID=UPI0040439EBF
MTTWQPAAATVKRPLWRAIGRGMLGRCPNCGRGALLTGFTRVRDACPACGEQLHHHRADDAPPYITITIVGHVVLGLVLWAEMVHAPPIWVHMVLWLPLTVALSLLLMRPVKGAVVGLQWALGMHGFGPEPLAGGRDGALPPEHYP